MNGVKIRTKDLAKEAEVALSTCKKRHKELLEKLVKVEEVGLPWGKDITVKNVIKHAGSIIGYMEAKSMTKSHKGKGDKLVHGGFCLEDIIRDGLSKVSRYGSDQHHAQDYVSQNVEVGGESRNELMDSNHSKSGEISVEQLSMIYNKFKDEVRGGDIGEQGMLPRRKDLEMVSSNDWWKGKSKLSQRLLLKEALEKDVGLDAQPPSYVNGCKAVERRREKKIKAGKLRINRIKNPRDATTGEENSSGCECTRKKRKIGLLSDIDWEELIIETLVLHQMKRGK